MMPRSSSASAWPVTDAAARLDFYLPPPDDRAYRRGKIQRLRDHITAWRGGGRTASAAADLSVWRSAAVSPTHRSASRHEKVLLLSRVPLGPRSPSPSPTVRRGHTDSFNNTTHTLGRVTEVPYFHDRTIFCLPRDTRPDGPGAAAPLPLSGGVSDDSVEAPQGEPGMYVCYGVTTNIEEMAQRGEQESLAAKTDCGGTTALSESTVSGGRFEGSSSYSHFSSVLLPNSFRGGASETHGVAGAAARNRSVDSFFAAKMRSVELAMTVHKERTRRKSKTPQQRSGSVHQRTFDRTMEIPIDWREFERLTPFGKASLHMASSNEAGRTSGAGPTLFTNTSGAHSDGKGPMRLYTIRMRKHLANTEGSMEKAANIPRFGTHVVLPNTWVE